ncbi:MAG TPA: glycosyltransferase family 4 protein [Solirubrobacteraceae bacterium]|jgi:glycosyltransferase involved in cell wall biosynthesis
MPSGTCTATCSAPLGVGGLGRHLQEIVEALARREQPTVCLDGASSAASETPARSSRPGRRPSRAELLAALPVPFSPGVRTRVFMGEFDAHAARRLQARDHLIAFNGQALGQFRAARSLGYASVSLVSANSHLRRVLRQHAAAHRRYPLEGSWAAHLLRRNLAEYEQADRVYAGSAYTVESFLEQGFPAEKLCQFPFTPDPRYRPAGAPASDTFEVVYIGSLSVAKGVPLLIDAFRRVSQDDLRLTLIGGWGSRGMRRFVEAACARDQRISVRPGDPLAHLRAASLCVHPTYEDGFGYAPAEALACGVPVIVTEDTGMKELIGDAGAGLVLPTGDQDALTEAIAAAYRGEILSAGARADAPRPGSHAHAGRAGSH